MKGAGELDFSLTIAFLLPGFVGFVALGYVSPRAAWILDATVKGEAEIGAAMVLLLCALACGVVLSGLRTLLLDRLNRRREKDQKLRFSALRDEHVLAAFKEAVSNTYRFSQFYGNMFLALLCVLAAKAVQDQASLRTQWGLYLAGVGGLLVLFLSHRRSLRETYRRMADILNPEPGKDPARGEEGR